MAHSSHADRDRVEAWVTTLRRVRPAAVVAVWDGGEQAVAIRSGATRWQHAAHTAHVLAIDHDGHVELRDASGGVVEMLSIAEDNPDPEVTEDAVTLSSSDARLLGVLVSAQRMVLQEQRELLEPLLLAYTQLAQGYAQYAAQVVELVKLAARVPAQESSADSDGNELMRMFMDQVTGRAPKPVPPVPPVPDVKP